MPVFAGDALPLRAVQTCAVIALAMTKPRLLAAPILLTLVATAAVAAPSRFEEGVFTELNRFRSDPAAYADYLSDYRPRFEGKLLVSNDDSEIDIMTREGVAAVDEAIRDLRRGERMKARGGGPYVNEVITYGHHTPEGVVDQLLIDDGVPGRGHRHSLLRPTHRYAGVACGRHPVHRTMCVTLMSETRDGSPPPPPKRTP